MAVSSVIRKEEIEKWHRLDAEFWRPEYLKADKTISRSDNVHSLGQIAKRMRKGIFYILAEEYVDQGVPFLRVSNVGSILLDTNDLVHVSEERNRRDKKTNFGRGDIVLSKTGGVGAAVIGLDSCNISQDLIGIEIVDRKRFNPYYVAAYLNTKFGELQLHRWFQGQVQMHLALLDARKILVSFPSIDRQRRIEQIVTSAERESDESERLYCKAERMVLDGFDWHNLDLSQPNAYSAPLEAVREARRLDAEYFQPRYERLLSHLKQKGKAEALAEVAPRVRRGLQPRYVEDGEITVVNSQHLGRYFVDVDATERTDKIFWTQGAKARLRKNDVLIYSTGAYIGRTNIWLESGDGIASNHVTIVRSEPPVNPMYLAVFLNSPPGVLQAERWASGSGQREIYPEDIGRFLVPVPPPKYQQQVSDLVEKAYQSRRKAKALLDEAKAGVVALVEKQATA